MNKTPIEWTHWSTNPLKMEMPDGTRVNACVHKSEGCRLCYAEAITRRWWKKEWGAFPGYTPALLKLGKPVLIEEELRAVLRLSARIATGKADPKENRIFWNDMTDEFLDFWPDEFINKLFAVRALTPNLIHQVLTKRAERMEAYFGSFYGSKAGQRGLDACLWADQLTEFTADVGRALERVPTGLPNVHLGVSVEDQKTADERIPLLLRTPAAVRFVSAEPLLGPVDLQHSGPKNMEVYPRIVWVIIGGESGPGARRFRPEWARSTIEQCKAAGVPVFVKQMGGNVAIETGDKPWRHNADVATTHGRIFLKDKKGGDISEWPEDLRVREFPA